MSKLPIDHKNYRKLKDIVFGQLQKVENYMGSITADPPVEEQDEESKVPQSPPSVDAGPDKEVKMAFEKKK